MLGRGGMAEVRDGWDTRLARPVAIKMLHPALSDDLDYHRRFDTEARAAAALNHPNIVAVYDSGQDRGVPYIVMERLPGRSLADAVRAGPLPPTAVQDVLAQTLAALTAAHRAGILHRDIKPGNILFADDGQVKVADFGIAKTAGSPHTFSGQVFGTLAYLSPDRVAGMPATAADDLYSVGVVGYEALTGRPPFTGDNLAALAHAIAEHRAVPLSQARPDIGVNLAEVIERAMSPDPAQRFRHADDMRAALTASAAHVAQPVVEPSTRQLTQPVVPPTETGVPAAPAPRKTARRIGVAAIGIAVLAVAIAALTAIATSSNSDNEQQPPPSAPQTTAPVPVEAPATTPAPAPTQTPGSIPAPVPAPTTSPVVAPPPPVVDTQGGGNGNGGNPGGGNGGGHGNGKGNGKPGHGN